MESATKKKTTAPVARTARRAQVRSGAPSRRAGANESVAKAPRETIAELPRIDLMPRARPRVIAVVAQKGGVGKTTLAMGLAYAAADLGHRVTLLDTDEQLSAARWQRTRQRDEKLPSERREPTVVPVNASLDFVSEEIEKAAAAKADWVFIDTAGKSAGGIDDIVSLADVVVVPVRDGAFDLDAVKKTLRVVVAAEKVPLAVYNDVPPQAHVRIRALMDAIRDMSPGKIMFGPAIGRRAELKNAQLQFRSTAELFPNSAAHREMQALLAYVEQVTRRIDSAAQTAAEAAHG